MDLPDGLVCESGETADRDQGQLVTFRLETGTQPMLNYGTVRRSQAHPSIRHSGGDGRGPSIDTMGDVDALGRTTSTAGTASTAKGPDGREAAAVVVGDGSGRVVVVVVGGAVVSVGRMRFDRLPEQGVPDRLPSPMTVSRHRRPTACGRSREVTFPTTISTSRGTVTASSVRPKGCKTG